MGNKHKREKGKDRRSKSINYAFPLRRGSRGAFKTNDLTVDAVVDDLKVLMLTNHGERPIHGDYGANLRSIVFDPSTSVLQTAEDLVLSAVEKWMPFVEVTEIAVTNSDVDANLGPYDLHIKLNFTVGQIEGSLDQKIRN